MATNSFESKFGILADSLLQDHLPAASKYSLGFQVVATEDDNERTLGVMAYQIGEYTVFVPVFWLSGKLKGGDIMYLKEANQWFPFSEVRLNYVETSKKFISGEVVDKDSRKGSADRVSTMELNWLTSKKAGEVSVFSADDCVGMVEMAVNDAQVSLEEHLSLFSPKAAADLAKWLVSSPSFANAVFRHHSPEEIGKVLGDGIDKGIPKEAADTEADVEIKIIVDPSDAASLSSEEKREFVDDGVVVVDKREDAAEAFVESRDKGRWVTPSTPGIYTALGSDYGTRTVAIIPNLKFLYYTEDSPREVDDGPALENVLLMDVEKGKYGFISSDKIPMVDQTAETPEDFAVGNPITAERLKNIWQEDLERWRKDNTPDNTSPEFAREANKRVHSNIVIIDGDGGYRTCLKRDATGSLVLGESRSDGDRMSMRLTNRPGRVTISNSTVYIPSTARVVHLLEEDREYYIHKAFRNSPPDHSSLEEHGYTTVKVATESSWWRITDSNYTSPSSTFPEAVADLVTRYGLRAKQAKDILRDPRTRKGLSFYVKLAYELMDSTGDDLTRTRESVGGPTLSRSSARDIEKASQMGVKEVLDTKILSEMAKSAYPVDKVKDSLPTLIKALDRLCRNLFYFYWHNESFADQYGNSNMDSLEDALKDNIQSLDDLVIYLQEKDAGPDDILQGGDREGDLTDGMR